MGKYFEMKKGEKLKKSAVEREWRKVKEEGKGGGEISQVGASQYPANGVRDRSGIHLKDDKSDTSSRSQPQRGGKKNEK